MTDQKTMLSDIELGAWFKLVINGLSSAVRGLSQMVGYQMGVSISSPKRIPVKNVLDFLGGPDSLTVGVYLSIIGAASGHMCLLYKPKTAYELVDMLMEMPPGSTLELGAMERSALGEMGNIMGSHFLSSLADATGLDLQPSPPAVIIDMAGAVLDIALTEIMMEADDTFFIEATMGNRDRHINGQFLVMPNPDLMGLLSERQCAL